MDAHVKTAILSTANNPLRAIATAIIVPVLIKSINLSLDTTIETIAHEMASLFVWHVERIVLNIRKGITDFTPKLILATEEGLMQVREPSITHDIRVPAISH